MLVNSARSILRPLAPRDPAEPHRVATPLELLTDLCFVVAVAQAATSLHHAISEGHAAAGFGHFLMVFFAIWWTWLNFTWFGSAYDNDDTTHRLLTILQILGSLVMAAGVARFFDGDALLIIAGYVIMRFALVIQWLRVSRGDPARRTTARRYAMGITIVQFGWIGFYFAPTAAAVPVFLALVACELAVPMWAERAAATPWHPHHVAERYSLFFIIVLGETILSTTVAIQDAVAGEHPAAQVAYVVVGGILIVFSLWWLYFGRSAGETLERGDRSPFVWGFGHYLIFAAAAAIGAGLAARVDFWTSHTDGSGVITGAALTIPVAVLLASLWCIHIRHHDSTPRTLVPFTVAIVAVLAGTFTPVPELVAGLVCAALLASQLVVARTTSSSWAS